MPAPNLTSFEHWLATDLKGALEFIMERHRSEREAELWLTILQLDSAMDLEMSRPQPNEDLLKKAQFLKIDTLRELGLPPTTDTKNRKTA